MLSDLGIHFDSYYCMPASTALSHLHFLQIIFHSPAKLSIFFDSSHLIVKWMGNIVHLNVFCFATIGSVRISQMESDMMTMDASVCACRMIHATHLWLEIARPPCGLFSLIIWFSFLLLSLICAIFVALPIKSECERVNHLCMGLFIIIGVIEKKQVATEWKKKSQATEHTYAFAWSSVNWSKLYTYDAY